MVVMERGGEGYGILLLGLSPSLLDSEIFWHSGAWHQPKLWLPEFSRTTRYGIYISTGNIQENEQSKEIHINNNCRFQDSTTTMKSSLIVGSCY